MGVKMKKIINAKGKEVKKPKFYLIQDKKTKNFVTFPLSNYGVNITRKMLLTEESIHKVFRIKEEINRSCKNCPYGFGGEYHCYMYDPVQPDEFCAAKYDKKSELDVYEIELKVKKIDSTCFMPNSYKKFAKEHIIGG